MIRGEHLCYIQKITEEDLKANKEEESCIRVSEIDEDQALDALHNLEAEAEAMGERA